MHDDRATPRSIPVCLPARRSCPTARRCAAAAGQVGMSRGRWGRSAPSACWAGRRSLVTQFLQSPSTRSAADHPKKLCADQATSASTTHCTSYGNTKQIDCEVETKNTSQRGIRLSPYGHHLNHTGRNVKVIVHRISCSIARIRGDSTMMSNLNLEVTRLADRY